MKLLVGLGNPGKNYEKNRHNIAFLILDDFVSRNNGKWSISKQFGAEICEVNMNGEKIICMKPMLYMNLSGGPVASVMRFYKIDLKDILVIHDEIDFDLARIAMKNGGSAGGHNGIKNIIEKLGTNEFARFRIGVGRPLPGSKVSVSDYVLGDFFKDEFSKIENVWEDILVEIERWINQ